MLSFAFNDGWKFRRLDNGEAWREVALPHDAMIYEKRTADSGGGVNTGWYEGYDYEYTKTFFVPKEYADKIVTIEFQGVYRNAEVYVNGQKAAYRAYGYTNFYVDISGYLRCGGDNDIRVIARNADQPNSRWYSGAGIYRPVTLFVADKKHILHNGVKIRTLGIAPAVVEVCVTTSEVGEVRVSLSREGKTIAADVKTTGKDRTAVFLLNVPCAELWSPDSPSLYDCKATFADDEVTVRFGIRTISCTPSDGFTLNGERVILRGACIHTDNGILGARSYREAEARKVRLLKENGYNAVRSAHCPAVKSFLDECDKQGMLVVDEYCDMWYIHKNKYDYAAYLQNEYEKDLIDMIEKDRNHPSVIMYSLGNEVAETSEIRGVELFAEMKAVCKRLDADRPVTVGVNLFFNYLYALGFGQYSDKKADKHPEKEVGSAFFNALAGRFGDKFMKTMAKLRGCDRKTRDCYALMDAAGYNYGIKRYKHDIKKYPERVILGSETFCSDAYAFWELAKKNAALIGDFVWAGMDYLGEVGVGSWEYREYAPEFRHGVGWATAGSGRLDLIGMPLGEALYTKTAFELCDAPQIAVVPVSHTGEKHSPSAWKFSNAIPSWSWNGLDGRKAAVEVYSRAPVVELYVNGKRVGRKKFKKNCRFDFMTRYRGGELTAVALDKNGNELSRGSLRTAGDETVISVLPEKPTAKAGEVCFVGLRYTDCNGTIKPLERGRIKVDVEGGELLALGHACPYNADGYVSDTTDTYYGAAMAVVRSLGGSVSIKATDGIRCGAAEIRAENG